MKHGEDTCARSCARASRTLHIRRFPEFGMTSDSCRGRPRGSGGTTSFARGVVPLKRRLSDSCQNFCRPGRKHRQTRSSGSPRFVVEFRVQTPSRFGGRLAGVAEADPARGRVGGVSDRLIRRPGLLGRVGGVGRVGCRTAYCRSVPLPFHRVALPTLAVPPPRCQRRLDSPDDNPTGHFAPVDV